MDIGGRDHEPRHRGVHRACRAGLGRRAAAAGRGRDRDRQDDDAGARAVAVHRVDHVGRDPQPVGHRPHARAAPAAARRPRWRRASFRPRWRPTAPARSGFPPPAAGCSASSRSIGRVPRAPHYGDNHWICFGGLTRSVEDAALMYDVMAPDIGREAPRPLKIAYSEAFPPLTTGKLDDDVADGAARHRRAPQRPRPHRDRARHRPAGPRHAGDRLAAAARDPRHRHGGRAPAAARAPHARDGAPRRARQRTRSSNACSTPRSGSRPASAGCGTSSTCC